MSVTSPHFQFETVVGRRRKDKTEEPSGVIATDKSQQDQSCVRSGWTRTKVPFQSHNVRRRRDDTLLPSIVISTRREWTCSENMFLNQTTCLEWTTSTIDKSRNTGSSSDGYVVVAFETRAGEKISRKRYLTVEPQAVQETPPTVNYSTGVY